MFHQINTSIKTAVLAAIMFSVTNIPFAQAQSINANQTSACRPFKRYTGSQNSMYETQPLKAAMHIQGVPEYRGKGASFENGLCYPRLKGAQCVISRYQAKDKPQELMDNYRSLLLENGWQINNMQSNSKQLTAAKKKEGLYLTVCVFPSSKPGFKSSFEIKYLATGAIVTKAY